MVNKAETPNTLRMALLLHLDVLYDNNAHRSVSSDCYLSM